MYLHCLNPIYQKSSWIGGSKTFNALNMIERIPSSLLITSCEGFAEEATNLSKGRLRLHFQRSSLQSMGISTKICSASWIPGIGVGPPKPAGEYHWNGWGPQLEKLKIVKHNAVKAFQYAGNKGSSSDILRCPNHESVIIRDWKS